MAKKNSGFIVHPWETSDGNYSASYGPNNNATVKSFKTLSASKRYLASKGITGALYDSPSGTKMISTTNIRKKPIRRKVRTRNVSRRTIPRSIADPLGLGFN